MTEHAYSYQERARVRRFSLIFYARLLSKEELGRNYDTVGGTGPTLQQLVRALFFERAFTESQGFKQLKQEIKELDHITGLP